jgi:hypothetical protein
MLADYLESECFANSATRIAHHHAQHNVTTTLYISVFCSHSIIMVSKLTVRGWSHELQAWL